MSHPQPPQRPPTTDETQRYVKALHNTAIAAVIACPILALLPPRKLDLYTWMLVGMTGYSGNYLVREQTGRPIWQHIYTPKPQQLPTQPQIQRQEPINSKTPQPSVTESVKDHRAAWKVQREKEIREDVEEGKSYADMITDQVWQVWTRNDKKPEDDNKK